MKTLLRKKISIAPVAPPKSPPKPVFVQHRWVSDLTELSDVQGIEGILCEVKNVGFYLLSYRTTLAQDGFDVVATKLGGCWLRLRIYSPPEAQQLPPPTKKKRFTMSEWHKEQLRLGREKKKSEARQ